MTQDTNGNLVISKATTLSLGLVLVLLGGSITATAAQWAIRVEVRSNSARLVRMEHDLDAIKKAIIESNLSRWKYHQGQKAVDQ